ncbi:HypC/HybG/HupF family hydrogenase formation chaperone [Candidatus Hydrogenedentota bacterium]
MCVAVPMRVEEIEDDTGMVEIDGVGTRVSLALIDDVKVGDYLIIHAGFAIEKLDEDDARETLKLFAELAERQEEATGP